MSLRIDGLLTYASVHIPIPLCAYPSFLNTTELPVELHRYRFDRRQWTKEDFSAHQQDHTMDVILPIPQSLQLLLRYSQ